MAQERKQHQLRLKRELGLWALVATAVCTVVGGGINVLSIEIQGAVPGVGGLVPLAFAVGAIPALLVAAAYAALASAMPRAGGAYVYISRGLSPFLGFIATFSQWYGFSIACGVIAYMDVALLKAAALYAHLDSLAAWLETPQARLGLPIAMIWLFWFINYIGVRIYGLTVSVLMLTMFAGGAVMLGASLAANHDVYAQAMLAKRGVNIQEVIARYSPPPNLHTLGPLAKAVVMLFFAYIGFETASQAGGEARDPRRTLPLALMLSALIIAGYYVSLSYGLYHAAPWQYVAQVVSEHEAELSMPEILGVLMPAGLAVFVALMAAVVLADDLPPMLLGSSRLFYAWACDGVFPRRWAAVHRRFRTPGIALAATAVFASLGALGCHKFGAANLGVDAVVLAILFNYAITGLTLITLKSRNPQLHEQMTFLKKRWEQLVIGLGTVTMVGAMLIVQVWDNLARYLQSATKALAAGEPAWKAWLANMPGCAVFPWLTMLIVGAIIFAASWRKAAREGQDLASTFRQLPVEEEGVEG
ncbi:MAG: APC family permease [Armatimonadetes bacterium]|nr:APC family permease [Armatimonadota bacterium]